MILSNPIHVHSSPFLRARMSTIFCLTFSVITTPLRATSKLNSKLNCKNMNNNKHQSLKKKNKKKKKNVSTY